MCWIHRYRLQMGNSVLVETQTIIVFKPCGISCGILKTILSSWWRGVVRVDFHLCTKFPFRTGLILREKNLQDLLVSLDLSKLLYFWYVPCSWIMIFMVRAMLLAYGGTSHEHKPCAVPINDRNKYGSNFVLTRLTKAYAVFVHFSHVTQGQGLHTWRQVSKYLTHPYKSRFKR